MILDNGMRLRRALLPGAAALLSACAMHAGSAPLNASDAMLQRILVAEDTRGTGAEGIAPLLDGAGTTDTTLRRVAVRGLGRLQRPALVPQLLRALDDSVPSIRAEAASALAQTIQLVPVGKGATDSTRTLLRRILTSLEGRLPKEVNDNVVGALFDAMGRVAPDSDTDVIRVARDVLSYIDRAGAIDWYRGATIDYAPRTYHLERIHAPPMRGILTGLFFLSRRTSASSSIIFDDNVSELRRAMATGGHHADVAIRRLALVVGTQSFGGPGAQSSDLATDLDPVMRRLGALNGVPVERFLNDNALIVRAEVARLRALSCEQRWAMEDDSIPIVRLNAIDQLERGCNDYLVAHKRVMKLEAGTALSADPRVAWQVEAHYAVQLAKTPGSPDFTPLLPKYAADPRAHLREYAARAADALGNAEILRQLSRDSNANVRAAAISGLARVAKHKNDSVYIAALESRAYPVVLAAANALSGTADRGAKPALFSALRRITAERRENSRDERAAIVNRIAELGTKDDAPELTAYLTDFDTTIAGKAAATLAKWTGSSVSAHPNPLPIRAEPLAAIFRSRNVQLRITMADSSGGGSVVVRLFTDETPATIARITRLARAHYYDGLTFHRVVSGFVIQGGSPGANEQVGDASFMRDEVGMRSHDRGTLGISTRGRDTGDAQFFVNLVDNPRLDHDYTVFGEVISGMDVVDHILEGDVMARVEVIGGTIQK